MRVVNKQLRIGGMTCVNCQNKIEQKLYNTAGITEVAVSYSEGTAWITYDAERITWEEIVSVIEKLDYKVLREGEGGSGDISRAICLLILLISLYVILWQLGILNLLVPNQLADSGMGYGMLFMIGLITSVHCIAMCGGINLTQCIPHKEGNMRKGWASVFRPAILYNLGRVISYTVIGFLLGLVGMLLGGGTGIGLSTLLQGILKLLAGALMIIMGINMLGIFPWLRKWNVRLPGFLTVSLGTYRGSGLQPLLVGLLNGLMPCGPLQSMQIVALASGNPFIGACSMLLFSLGTVPMMLGLGSLVAALGKRFTHKVMSVGAVLVVVLGLAMLEQGGSLSGLLLPEHLLVLVIAFGILGVIGSISFDRPWHRTVSLLAAIAIMIAGGTFCHSLSEGNNRGETAQTAEDIEIVDGVQIVNSTLASGSYPEITVFAGLPVKWVIYAPEGSINGCNYKMLVDEYGIEYAFQEGENIIEFTPEEAGVYGYTCWMGMIHSNINVVDRRE